MNRSRELNVGDRLLALFNDGPPPATNQHSTISASVYTDPTRHAAELSAMSHHPVAALAASQLTEPGSFHTTELAGRNVIITRDNDGHVHAMLNACAHRGATVEHRPSGSARVFSCGFHGWSYDLDGSLRSITDASLFSATPCTTGLHQLACEERHGIIWVTPDPASSTRVADWLGPDIDELLVDLGAGSMVHHAETDYDLACNWKLLTDGFLELYHLKYLHRNSIAPYFPSNTFLIDRHEHHFIGWLPKSRLMRDISENPREDWQVYGGMTAPIVLVPGTVIQWQAGHIELFSLRPHPIDPTRTTARLTMLVPEDRQHDKELWDRNWERVCATIPAEDFAAAEEVQRNINSGAVTELQIGANEHALVDHLTEALNC